MIRLLVLGLVLLPCVVHAQSFTFSLHAFDDGADISGTTADGGRSALRRIVASAHPFEGGADMVFRYSDGHQQECRLGVAPFSGNVSGECRLQER